MIEQNSKLNTAAFLSLAILFCECVVGSSGRWLEIGSISIRMLLFGIAFFMSLPFVIKSFFSVIRNKVIISIVIFGVFVLFSLIYGYVKSNNTQYIVADLTSMLFLLIVPGFVVIFNTSQRIESLIKYASYASGVLALITVILHFALLWIGDAAINIIEHFLVGNSLGGFFNFGDGFSRIYFRSSICFILPFFYGLYVVIKHKKDGLDKRQVMPYVLMSISLIAIVLTFTRSIWFGVLIAVILFFIINIKQYKAFFKGVGIAIAGFLLFVAISWICYGSEGIIKNAFGRVLLGYNYSVSLTNNDSGEISEEAVVEESPVVDEPYTFEDRQKDIALNSEAMRNDRLKAVAGAIKENWLLGGGFGLTLNLEIYEGKVEYTYMDVFSKMGIFGLLSFIVMLLVPVLQVYKNHKQGRYNSSMGILMCVMVCIYMASFFNPFLTSPIGFSLFALFAASVSLKPQDGASV
jgi:hypothetical protein